MTVATRDELVLAARKLAPALARRARECERLRRLPDETIADFKRAGLLRAFVPPEHGGYGLEIGTVIDTTREIGRACGNSAWCLAICTLHNHIAAAYPESVRARVFANGPDPIVCGVFMPGGRATAAAGGFRLSGAWDFASTCDHAEFAVLAAFLHDEPDGPPRGMGSCLIERASFSIEDNWHVSGLCGTGSKRVIVEDVLVPEDHVLIGSLEGGIAPDREVARGGGPGLPGNSVASLGLVGVALGIAEGALERFRGRIATKLRFTSGKSPEQQIGAQDDGRCTGGTHRQPGAARALPARRGLDHPDLRARGRAPAARGRRTRRVPGRSDAAGRARHPGDGDAHRGRLGCERRSVRPRHGRPAQAGSPRLSDRRGTPAPGA
jgi:3-hydroxy-9,10-secoandrosta-1,3,5(10)-triene-9,17-dione monooxygenase